MDINKQVKSKKRVADHGEVFTNEREVNAMLDLVKQETERIDSRFLEPACGDGNFLAEILRRKLAVVKRRYKTPSDFEINSVLAVTSIYGVDILQDNVDVCRERLFNIWDTDYIANCKKEVNDECRAAVKFIIERNILCGDALTLKKSDNEPIIFSEWSLATGLMIQRRDFRLDEMLDGHAEQKSLYMDGWVYDEEVKALIPLPVKVFPLIEYWRVHEHGN